MNLGTLQALAVAALAAAPGVLVLEVVRFGRPPLRPRDRTRTFAIYLFLSVLVWWAGAQLFDVGGRLADLISLRPQRGQGFVDAVGSLAGDLLLAALLVGCAARLVLWVARSASNRL